MVFLFKEFNFYLLIFVSISSLIVAMRNVNWKFRFRESSASFKNELHVKEVRRRKLKQSQFILK